MAGLEIEGFLHWKGLKCQGQLQNLGLRCKSANDLNTFAKHRTTYLTSQYHTLHAYTVHSHLQIPPRKKPNPEIKEYSCKNQNLLSSAIIFKNRENMYWVPQICKANSRFHSDAKLPFVMWLYPLANHSFASYESSSNHELSQFSCLFASFKYLQKLSFP